MRGVKNHELMISVERFFKHNYYKLHNMYTQSFTLLNKCNLFKQLCYVVRLAKRQRTFNYLDS